LDLSAIIANRRQPRSQFDEGALADLAASIRQVGVLQPILVRRAEQDGMYELIAGERRYRAAGLAGLQEIPAVVRDTADGDLLTEALVENIHRTDLNPMEEAGAYQQLLDDFGMTHEALAQRIGRSRSAISNVLRLLALPPGLQQLVVDGALSAGHARALLALDSAEEQQRVGQRVVAEGLSVRATEELVRRLLAKQDGASAMADLAAAARRRKASPYEGLQQRIGDVLGTRVRIKGTAGRGRIVIDYSGAADLERLLQVLGRGTGEQLLSE
jgi:ParB family chromosome partitioning protein